MEQIYFVTLIMVLALWLLYDFKIRKDEKLLNIGTEHETWKQMIPLMLLLGAAFLIKSYCTTFAQGHTTDVTCFQAWSDMVYQNGITKFYHLDAFTDYPPGYMYVLYVVAWIRGVFDINVSSDASVYLLKLFPMLCDLGTGYLIYKLARKKFSNTCSVILTGVYVLSPAVVLNSSVWCQVDSVFTLTVLLTCYLCMEKKRIPAYFVFAIGVLLKPQTLIFTPILIFTIIEQVFLQDFNWKKFVKDLCWGLGAIVTMLLLAMPFGLDKVISQYRDTLGSYEYASVNAYNFWALLGQNWKTQSGTLLGMEYRHWGELAILVAVALGAWIFFKLKEDKSKYFLSMAAIVCTMFIFSVRMHERYMYPAMALILIGYVISRKKEMFYCFIGVCVTQFVNAAHVLYYNLELGTSGVEGKVIDFTAILLILIFVYFIYSCLHVDKPVVQEKPQKKHKEKKVTVTSASYIRGSKVLKKLGRADYIVLFSIIILYSAFAFSDLGSLKAPQTHFDSQKDGNVITLDLGESKDVASIYSYLGNFENCGFKVETGDDLNVMQEQGDYTLTSVFNWENFANFPATKCRYIRFASQNGECILKEMVLLDSKGKMIQPVNANQYPNLFDEPDTFEAEDTFRSGTYFDEIYHARTAYEMTQGIYCYENTHPPLGKFIISIGVRIFGMNPFGWRVMGTLFGVLMLPFMYMFGKRMFDKVWLSGVITALFAFDFMHFTQTRIATIDVYGTFFIIAMYYFMYRYAQTSFYDTKLSKTLIPLALSGLCMGLGMASKWTAVYAGAGLGIVFFAIMWIRYREYRYAKKHIKEATGTMLHKDIVEGYRGNLIKTLGACVIFFVIVPALIYLLSYIPFNDGSGDGLITQLLRNQETMFSYHSQLVAEHPYSSWWYEWPTMIRPVFYYSKTLTSGLSEGISAFGNPLVWWAGIPALGYMFYLIFGKKDRTALFITAAYFIQYVPWMFVTRITFAYHYFPSVVFVVLMIGYCMKDYVGNHPERIKHVVGYVIAAFLLFLMFYPVISGQPIDSNYVAKALRWEGIKIGEQFLLKLQWVLMI